MGATTTYANVTPYFCVKGAADAIEFYRRAFGAVENHRIDNGDGTLGHAEIVIGGTVLFLSDEWAEQRVLSPLTLNGNSIAFVLMVDDLDAAWQRALDAGAKVERPVVDSDHGRGGWLRDPFGHRWNVMARE